VAIEKYAEELKRRGYDLNSTVLPLLKTTGSKDKAKQGISRNLNHIFTLFAYEYIISIVNERKKAISGRVRQHDKLFTGKLHLS